jgi:plastocyanin
MHAAAVHLAPILGAEKSKVPFYIAGGLLVAWALIISLGIGMRNADFPKTLGAQRAVIAITAVLVVVTVAAAVATSGGEKSTAHATAVVTAAGQAPSPPVTVPAPPAGTPRTPAPRSSSSPAPASTLLALAANPAGQLSYNTKNLAAHAGQVTIVMANMSPEEHNVTVAEGSKVLGATPTFVGGSKRLTLTLKPGKYTFYCSVPGHRQGGMEGTLTIS